MKFRKRIRYQEHTTTYIACPKQKAEGTPRTNHAEDCEKCSNFISENKGGVFCDWVKDNRGEKSK